MAGSGRLVGPTTTLAVVLGVLATTVSAGRAGPLQSIEGWVEPTCVGDRAALEVTVGNDGLEPVDVLVADPVGTDDWHVVLPPAFLTSHTFVSDRAELRDGEVHFVVTDALGAHTTGTWPHPGAWCGGEPTAPPEPSPVSPSDDGGPSEQPTDDGAEPAAGRRHARLAGPDRWTTATAISRYAWPRTAEVVYLARGVDPLVDALAGGMLRDGPTLPVPTCGEVPNAVRAEVSRLSPTRVVALGGPTAVCDDVLRDVADGRGSGRIAGTDRHGTAVAVSAHTFPTGAPVVYLARSDGALVDALAGGTLTDGPVLLVPHCGDLPDVVRDEIARLDPEDVVALGGRAAVCDDVLAEAARARRAGRVAGTDRWSTATAISRRAWSGGTDVVHLARGTDPLVDALAGGTLHDGPVLLVPPCGPTPVSVHDEVERLDPGVVHALGGPSAVCDDVLRSAARRR